jgi:hypothetical protein
VPAAAVAGSDEEEVVDYDSLQPGGEVDRAIWIPASASAQHKVSPGSRQSATVVRYREIQCLINDENPIACRQDEGDGEVFIPFSFIRKYFEVIFRQLMIVRLHKLKGSDRLGWLILLYVGKHRP